MPPPGPLRPGDDLPGPADPDRDRGFAGPDLPGTPPLDPVPVARAG
jgi:hypothetical protein